MSVSLRPVHPSIGVEIVGLDLHDGVSSETCHMLWQAVQKDHLILLRNQQVTPAAHVAISKAFGSLQRFSPDPSQLDEFPEIFRVANVDGAGYTNIGYYWHSDGLYAKHPNRLSLFHMVEIPENAGETLFTNLYAVYERLPSDLKRRIADLNAIHYNGRVHPLVRVDPTTGRPAVLINFGLTHGILDLRPPQSEEVLERLSTYFDAPDTYYTHRWLPGDFIIVDNMAVAHHATSAGVGERRILHRTSVTRLSRTLASGSSTGAGEASKDARPKSRARAASN